ncbi:DUF4352 domain-containing protein [Isoptericola sp. NPDC019693]|uniref:DUF4352 domain-containing protein n=1 Tax=Isoptericola sp. NPDC019693 TaxID=3364009 RepID=UPI003798D88C
MSTPHPDPSQQPVPPQPGQQPQQYPQQQYSQEQYPQQPYGQPQPGQQAPYGAPQGWSQQPQMPPAPEKRKNWFARHKVLTGLGAAVALVVIIASTSGGGGGDGTADVDATTAQQAEAATDEAADKPAEGTKTENTEKPAKEEKADTLPAVGDKVRDGKFEFTVTKLEDGVQEVGDEFLSEKAQGQFVLVHMTVENIGDEAQYFDGSSQSLVDTEGRTHSADSEAAIYLDESNSFLNEINPGNTVDGVVVFDIPEKATPETLELHDSMFSGGVEVAVK